MTMQKRLRGMILAVAMSFAAYGAYAENITVSTYYPSPFGSYQQLDTTGHTHLATVSGGVMVGAAGNTASKFEVSGGTSVFGGNVTVNANSTVTGVSTTNSLSITGSPGGTGTLQVSCASGNCYAVYA